MINLWISYLSCMLVINGFGMAINFLVIVMFLRFQSQLLSLNNNKFLFSLAIADCLVGLFGVTGGILEYLFHRGLADETIKTLCGILPLFGSFFMSILSLGVLTADRLIAMVYTLKYHSIMTQSRVNLVICFSWIAVAVIIVIQGTLYLRLSSSLELAVRTYQLLVFFVIGTTVLIVGNLKLHFVISRKQTESPGTSVVGTTKINRNMDSRICIWMVTAFVVCWLPLTVNYVVYLNGYPGYLRFVICMCIAASNSLINPIIYLAKRRNFRKRFRQFFICS